MKTKYIFLLLLVPLLVQCTARKAQVQSTEEVVSFDKDQVWQLVAIQGKMVARSSTEIILMFHPESGTLRGRVACNRYFADYTLGGRYSDAEKGSHHSPSTFHLSVSNISGGDVQCPEGGMAEQERYLALLGRVDACQVDATSLTLYRNGKETLKFELQ